MNCQDCQERIVEILSFASLADIPELKTGQLMEHLSACPNCRQEWNETLEAFAVFPLGLDSVAPSEGFADAIVERINGRSDPRPGPKFASLEIAPEDEGSKARVSTLSKRHRLISYALAASVLLAVVGGQWIYLRRVDAIARASRDPSEEERLRSTEQAISEMNRLQRHAGGSQLRFVSITRERARAHIVLDLEAGDLHFHGLGLDPLMNGESYAVWLVTKDETRFVRSFQPEADGSISFVANAESLKVTDQELSLLVTIESEAIGDLPSEKAWGRDSLSLHHTQSDK